MDIRDKLLETVDANDPQFKILLHNAIQAEIKCLEEQLSAKRARNERKRLELKGYLERRKELKKSIKEKSEYIPMIESAYKCLQDYSNELFYEMTLTQNMLDDDSLRQLAYIEEEKKLLAVLEKKCNEYEAEYEKDPLAQELRKLKQQLLKLEVELQMRKMNIKDMEKNYKIYQEIQEKREKQQIIAIAKLWLKHRDSVKEWYNLRKERAELNSIIAKQEQEIQFLIKEKADKQSLMARFQMPPPVMDTRFVETMFSQSRLLTTETKTSESMVDTFSDNASICSSVFEEICNRDINISYNRLCNTAEAEVEQIQVEPDVVSLISNEDSQCTEVDGSEKSIQSVKEINDNIALKKTNVPKPKEKLVSTNLTPQRKRSDVSTPRNVTKKGKSVEQFSKNLGAVKKVRTERSSYSNTNVPMRLDQLNQFDIPGESVTIEDDLQFQNPSICGSDNSCRFSDSNIQRKDPGGKDPSDVSLQSFPDDQNNSIVFTGDEMSNTENDISPSEQNSPPPATSAPKPFGFFGSQKKHPLDFTGFFK